MKQSVPYKVVKQASQNKDWDTLVYYMWLRNKFRKKIFYNYTSRTIASHLGISHTQANFHIRKMIALGLASVERKHLRLLCNDNQEMLIAIPIYRTKREQIVALKNILVNRNLLRQQKAISRKTDIVTNASKPFGKISKSAMKMIRSCGSVAQIEMSINNRTTLSNEKIGEILGVSKREASRLQSEMVKMGFLRCNTYFEWFNGDIYNLPPNVFFYRGYLVKRCSNTLLPILPIRGKSLQ